MSNAAPSVVLHQGMRCTKVPRAAPAPALPSPPPISQDSSEAHFSLALFHTPPTLSDNKDILSTLTDNSITGVSPALTTTNAGNDASTVSNADNESVTHATGRIHTQTLQSSRSDVLGGVSGGSLSSPTGFHTQPTGGTLHISPSSATGTASAGNDLAHDPANTSSHAGNESTSTKTIVGSVLGSLAFLAVILLICLFAIRRRRHRSQKKHVRISNDQLLQSGRDSSVDLQHRYQSPVTPPPPCPDTPQFEFGIPQRIPQDRSSYTNNNSVANMSFVNLSLANPPLARSPEPIENPFASPEDPPEPHDPFIVRRRYSSSSVYRPDSQAELEKALLFRKRPYLPTANSSEQSLGSTIILPGRSSLESDDHKSKDDDKKEETKDDKDKAKDKEKKIEIEDEPYLSTPSMSPRETIRTSARSDPFDLEAPRNSTIDKVLKMTAHWKREY